MVSYQYGNTRLHQVYNQQVSTMGIHILIRCHLVSRMEIQILIRWHPYIQIHPWLHSNECISPGMGNRHVLMQVCCSIRSLLHCISQPPNHSWGDSLTVPLHRPDGRLLGLCKGLSAPSRKTIGIPTSYVSPQYIAAHPESTGLAGISWSI